MTDREEREKVIEILQYEKKTALHDNKWAFDYAIASIKTDLKYNLLYEETSEQADKSTPKNDLAVDAISRQAVLDLINADWKYEGLEIEINNLPSVTPQEPRKGHWMGDSYGYICSNCEHSLNDLAQSMDYISFSKPKYCPNCGADMREVEE